MSVRLYSRRFVWIVGAYCFVAGISVGVTGYALHIICTTP